MRIHIFAFFGGFNLFFTENISVIINMFLICFNSSDWQKNMGFTPENVMPQHPSYPIIPTIHTTENVNKIYEFLKLINLVCTILTIIKQS